MNGELKAKWLEALRSGRYEQGRHYLRNKEDQFCCLGVLCDVSGPGQWKEHDSGNAYSFYPNNHTLSYESDFGISRGYRDMIIMMNDTYRLSFERMADWIEENVKED